MKTINYQYESINENRFGKKTYLIDCIEDGHLIRCKTVSYGYINKYSSLSKMKGWFEVNNFFNKDEILNYFVKKEATINLK